MRLDKDGATKVNISATARLIYQLGEELIEDEFVALLELIKNSYDADATAVRIVVDTKVITPYGQGKIIIEDNGNGMLPSTIKGAFLKISTGYKKENKFSPYFKRKVLGEKGLGRLSIQRLGNFVTANTIPNVERLEPNIKDGDLKDLQENNEFEVELDWRMFQDPNLDLYDIYANFVARYSKYNRYGTRLEISGIRNLSFWNLNTKLKERIKTEIYSMLNPFTQTSKEKKSEKVAKEINNKLIEDQFDLMISIDKEIIKTESVSEEIIESVSDVVVDFAFKDWILNVNLNFKKKYERKQIDDVLNSLVNSHKFTCISKANAEETNIEFSFNFNDEEWRAEHPKFKNIEFYALNENKNEKAYPGDFHGKMYSVNFSLKSEIEQILAGLNEKETLNFKQFKSMWDSASGIYVFRNMFRVLPYGKGIDWLGFDKIYRIVKRNIFSSQTTAGYVVIESESSNKLVEQTNRQGFIKDEYGENFFILTRDILANIVTRADVKYREGYEVAASKINSDQELISTYNEKIVFQKNIVPEQKHHDLIENLDSQFEKIGSLAQINELNLKSLLTNYISNENAQEIMESKDEEVIIARKSILENSTINIGRFSEDIKAIREKVDELKLVEKELSLQKKQEKFLNDQRIKRLESIVSLAGQSIIIESLTHEFNRIEQNIKGYATQTKKELRKILKNDNQYVEMLKICIAYQDNILYENSYLKMQLKHLEPTYQNNKSVFEEFSLYDFLTNLYIGEGPMAFKASKQNVKIFIKGDFSIYSNKGVITTVFDNLFLNTLYWLADSETKEFHIDISEEKKVKVWDSGFGIHPEIENELFEPYKSLKPDGRGLGLFIVKQLLENLDASINLDLNNRNSYGRKYIFNIQF